MNITTPALPRRSMGLKLLLVCGLAVLMSIPALFVVLVLMDRSNRAQHVVEEISGLVGGPQTFTGPVLVVPYIYSVPANGEVKAHTETGTYLVSPKTGGGVAAIEAGVKERGPFKAITWTTDLALSSHFDLTGVGAEAPKGAVFDWSQAEVVVGATDARGAHADVSLALGDKTVMMAPATRFGAVELQAAETARANSQRLTIPNGMTFFSAPAGTLAQPGAVFDAKANLKFGGAQRLAMLAFAETTTFRASGDWPDPSYDGGFLPVRHSSSDTPATRIPAPEGGFAAEWQVPYIARGVSGEGDVSMMSKLGQTSLGISLIDQKNPHQAVSRSLKYAVMFVGLVFLAYFLFETTQKQRVHPAQYVLIGLAQMIFYLLLLSVAEIVGFDIGFAIAAVATVGLISAYAGWVFKSAKQGYIALIAFAGLYGLIYVLMRLEDRALLVGAFASFTAIAAVMYFTRNIDWYGSDAEKAPGQVKEGG